MQRYDTRFGDRKPPNTTFALAQFLATTGPDGNMDHPQPNNKMNLFDRLRKKTSHANTKYVQQQQQQERPMMIHRKYIPLADDLNQPNGDRIPIFPTPPTSSLHESIHDKPSLSASTSASELTCRRKKSIRGLRHIQVQTEDVVFKEPKEDGAKDRCDLCCRPFNRRHVPANRRASCPAALASGAKIKLGQEATLLLGLIDQLKQQLAEEQQSRKILEKAIQLQWKKNETNLEE
ncbi:hypothetical protein BC941DRAFT_120959 [Chlamydoabsidia padenii]|nr:hypothetical protein BC941DRAFT_120959 [Chlamydoabsidia padenii]